MNLSSTKVYIVLRRDSSSSPECGEISHVCNSKDSAYAYMLSQCRKEIDLCLKLRNTCWNQGSMSSCEYWNCLRDIINGLPGGFCISRNAIGCPSRSFFCEEHCMSSCGFGSDCLTQVMNMLIKTLVDPKFSSQVASYLSMFERILKSPESTSKGYQDSKSKACRESRTYESECPESDCSPSDSHHHSEYSSYCPSPSSSSNLSFAEVNSCPHLYNEYESECKSNYNSVLSPVENSEYRSRCRASECNPSGLPECVSRCEADCANFSECLKKRREECKRNCPDECLKKCREECKPEGTRECRAECEVKCKAGLGEPGLTFTSAVLGKKVDVSNFSDVTKLIDFFFKEFTKKPNSESTEKPQSEQQKEADPQACGEEHKAEEKTEEGVNILEQCRAECESKTEN